MHERLENTRLVGERRVEYTRGDTKIVIEETAAPRGRSRPKEIPSKFFFPRGTIESLKPLLGEVFRVNGIERDESYWLDIDDAAEMTPAAAYKKIRKVNKRFGGITVETIAHVVLGTDQILHEEVAFGRVTPEQVKGWESLLAGRIIQEYKKSLQGHRKSS